MLFGKVIAQTRGWTFVWLLLAPAFITETQVMSSQDCSLLLPPLPVQLQEGLYAIQYYL